MRGANDEARMTNDEWGTIVSWQREGVGTLFRLESVDDYRRIQSKKTPDPGVCLLQRDRAGQRLEDAVDDVAVDHFAADARQPVDDLDVGRVRSAGCRIGGR